MGAINKSGYGVIATRGLHRLAHRASVELHRGPIEPGKLVCHKCDVPGCVNPDHLYVGTHWHNSRDRMIRGRSNSHPRSHFSAEQVKAMARDKRHPARIAAEHDFRGDLQWHLRRVEGYVQGKPIRGADAAIGDRISIYRTGEIGDVIERVQQGSLLLRLRDGSTKKIGACTKVKPVIRLAAIIDNGAGK